MFNSKCMLTLRSAIMFSCLFFAQSLWAAPGLAARPDNDTCLAPDRPVSDADIQLQQVISAPFPLSMVQAPNTTERWYVVDRSGFINIYQDGATFALLGQFVNIDDRITREFEGRDWGEMGLLGLVFHPDFANNGYAYLYYSAANNDPNLPLKGVVSRFVSNDGGLTLDPSSEQVIIEFERDTQWHWGGQMLFGDDGYFYMAIGDAGRHFNSQDINSLHGKMLRLDVDSAFPYAAPADNPYVGIAGRDEIYALGFRNPWRWNFDDVTGELWMGDVGTDSYEEVNKVVIGGNYGWSVREGAHCTGKVPCTTAGLIDPIFEYPHDPNSAFNAIIGGYIYRGSALTGLQGAYIYGDNYTGEVHALTFDAANNPTSELLLESGEFLTTFAQGPDNELYLLAQNGVYRLINAAPGGGGGGSVFPQLLSETGCFDPVDPKQPAAGLIPYDLNTPLWSDGAIKERWMALPNGTTVDRDADGDFLFPIGTVLIKNFSIGDTLAETRLFIRHDDGGWAGYSYEWNAAQTDATLLADSKIAVVNGQSWFYPSGAQCVQCHTDVSNRALGPEIAQLNKDFTYPSTGLTGNQLETLEHIGVFTVPLGDIPANLPALAAVDDFAYSAEDRARAYLHANCAFCHRPDGPGQGPEDFRYWIASTQIGAINVPPTQSDLGIPDALLIYPGNPGKSILSLRMHALDGSRMPPLATSVVDPDGTGAVDEWIRSIDQTATCGAPTYSPGAEAAMYIWEECGTGIWTVRTTAGGDYGRFAGDVTSNAPLSFVTPFSIEGHDDFDFTTDPQVIDFDLQIWGSGEDGFEFGFQSGSGACLTVDSALPVYIGSLATPLVTPVDLETLGPCQAPPPPPPPPPGGTQDGQPTYNPGANAGFYLWRDAGDTWHIRATAGGGYANYVGSLTDQSALPSVTPVSIEAHDVFDFTTDPSRIDFNLQIWGAGDDGADFRIPASGSTCLELTSPAVNPQVIVGAGNTVMVPPFDIRTLGACDGGPPPPPPPPPPDPNDGPPDYDPTTETAFFIWHEAPDIWRVRSTAGGDFGQYIGSLSSNQPFTSVIPVSVEGHDTFNTPNVSRIEFNFRIWGTSEDGFDITIPNGAPLCLNVDQSAGAQIQVGGTRVSATAPVDVTTMLPCVP